MKKYLFYCLDDELDGAILTFESDEKARALAANYEAECIRLTDEGTFDKVIYNPYQCFEIIC